MLKHFSKSFRVLQVAALAAALCLPAIAQGQSQSSAQPAGQTKKSGASVSCDGALDIVPTKSMSFVRKRRPNKTDAKPQNPPADSKKPSGDAKSGK